MKLSEELHTQARTLVASRLGLDFSERRRADLERGLVHAAGTSSEPALRAYLTRLVDLPESSPELMHLAQGLTVGETYFFRDRRCFEVLEQEIFPALISARRKEGTRRLRIWSAACATGEEPYSVAILLDRLLPDRAEWAITILATDINPHSLQIAERALYRDWSFRGSPEWLVGRYFRSRPNGIFELDSRIRGMVTFAPLNLAASGYPSALTNTAAMDLILCRNALMYFTEVARRAAAARLQRALVANGWLALSAIEASPELFGRLVPATFEGAAFFRKSVESASQESAATRSASSGGVVSPLLAAPWEGAALEPTARALPPPVQAPPDAPAPGMPPVLDRPQDQAAEDAGAPAETAELGRRRGWLTRGAWTRPATCATPPGRETH
ncbi:MAG: hypothetical protein HY534_05720 [Chloroflexi bacterium]|nr:hypothetical protein [Chloroflexota bacterium]